MPSRTLDKIDFNTRIVPVQKAFSLFTRRSPSRRIHGFLKPLRHNRNRNTTTTENRCRTPDLTVAIPDDPLYNIGDASFWGHLGGTFGRRVFYLPPICNVKDVDARRYSGCQMPC